MPFQIVCADISRLDCDAIVELAGGAGAVTVDPEPGSIAVTDAVGLPCRYSFRVSAPVWERKRKDKKAQLRDCYLRALRRGEEMLNVIIFFCLNATLTSCCTVFKFF